MTRKIMQIEGSDFKFSEEKSTCIEMEVPAHQVMLVDVRHSRVRIKCIDGAIWITRKNDPSDYVLHKEQVFSVLKDGELLLEGIPSAKLCVTV